MKEYKFLSDEINNHTLWFKEQNTEYNVSSELFFDEKKDIDDDLYHELISNAFYEIENSIACRERINKLFVKELPKIKEINPFKILKCKLIFSKMNKEIDKANKKDNEHELVFTVTKPRYSFDQIILPEKLKNEVFEAIGLIEHTDLIYNTWGFSEVDSIPRSIINFYGPPGTGKTMTAHAICKELNHPLLALNYSEIESKFVGEAPKNLVKAFSQAKETNAILFFDEADSFLGKRMENVTSGSEQAINSLRSQMLILLEEFSGVVIFATNLVTNFDKAFESRILKHLRFDLPNLEARTEIIKKMIPTKLPLASIFTDEEYSFMSENAEGFSGREIKGVVLETLLKKANQHGTASCFSSEDFMNAFKNKKEEKQKLADEELRTKKEKIMKALTAQSSVNMAEDIKILDTDESIVEKHKMSLDKVIS